MPWCSRQIGESHSHRVHGRRCSCFRTRLDYLRAWVSDCAVANVLLIRQDGNPPPRPVLGRARRYVAVEVHSYDPFDYAGPFATRRSWGTADDIAQVHAWVNTTQAWAAQKNVSILYGEFGTTYLQSPLTGRLEWYKVHVDAALGSGFAVAVWDDDGWFGIVNRSTRVWNEGVLQAMGLGKRVGAP
jgi:hypothetical protein